MNGFKSRWSAFFFSIFDPWILILLIATIALATALLQQTDTILVATFTVLVSLTSGLLGGVIGKRWEDITGEATTKARGKAAIRSLKLLFGSTAALERRSRLYLSRYTRTKSSRSSHDLVSTYLEEIIERCTTIEEEVLSSIENWTDIIPEADVKSQIGLITELKLKVDALTADLKRRNVDLKQSKGRSQAEIDKLTREKEKKEKELDSVRRELAQRSSNFGPPISTGAFQPAVIPYIPSPSTVIVQGGQSSWLGGYTQPILPQSSSPVLKESAKSSS